MKSRSTERPFTTSRVFAASCLILAIGIVVPALADHNGSHATACDEPNTVGGGTLGNSPGPVGPPSSLGWDVGGGQCNGSFTSTTTTFPDGLLELAMRIEERRVGQVTRIGSNEYEVELGEDQPGRAWWNFQHSIAYEGAIADLDSLTFKIRTDVGPNLPSAPFFDMLGVTRVVIDDRNNQPNATTGFADLYQTSQNPEFGWFTVAPDTSDPIDGDFDNSVEGAWVMTLTAKQGDDSYSVSICVHTPGAQCQVACCVGGGTPNTPAECVLMSEDECRANGDRPVGSTCYDVDCYPLAVTYDSVNAEATKDGVMLTWTTESEIDNVGFRVLRETSHHGEKSVELISDLIPAAGQNLEGMSYQFLDSAKQSESAVSYYIEDVDLYGRTNRYGPITIERFERPTPSGHKHPHKH